MDTKALRGVCSIEIMLGHIGVATGSILLYPSRKAGILFVGVFFWLSGYGLIYSMNNKENYLKNFVYKKIKKLVIPAGIVYMMFEIVKFIGGGYKSWNAMINPLRFFEQTNWYVWECLILYIIFWIAYRFTKEENADRFILVCSIGLILIFYLLNVSNPWYGSTICFWLGIKYYKNEIKIQQIILCSKWKFYLLDLILIVSSIGLFFISDERNFFGIVLARNIASAVFTILIIMLLQEAKIGNKVSDYMGVISYEIFLIHPFVIENLKQINISDTLYAWMVILITILCAGILYGVKCKFKNIYRLRKGCLENIFPINNLH